MCGVNIIMQLIFSLKVSKQIYLKLIESIPELVGLFFINNKSDTENIKFVNLLFLTIIHAQSNKLISKLVQWNENSSDKLIKCFL